MTLTLAQLSLLFFFASIGGLVVFSLALVGILFGPAVRRGMKLGALVQQARVRAGEVRQ